MIREMISEDSSRVLEIYKMGVDTHNATFETNVPSWADWDSNHLKHSRFVYTNNEKVLGWVAISPVSSRSAYKGVAEVSIYVETQTQGKGIGSLLMEKVITSSEEHGIWTLFSSVFPENKATLKLHEKFDFRIIGKRERIAQMNGKWRDTIQSERRSKIVGI
jgi:L-amino acid N-acyltransferase YncA